jgi:DNA-binding NarL/FixJ family response regulator
VTHHLDRKRQLITERDAIAARDLGYDGALSPELRYSPADRARLVEIWAEVLEIDRALLAAAPPEFSAVDLSIRPETPDAASNRSVSILQRLDAGESRASIATDLGITPKAVSSAASRARAWERSVAGGEA